jgi:formylglycine-generating enzyme required for sulfatase activity
LDYPDANMQDLSQALEAAYEREGSLLLSGADVSSVRDEVRKLQRQIRAGGQLRAGDFLLHGRFQLAEILGQGGFARVWKALDRKRRKVVAIKVLHGQYAQDRSKRERFFRGARLMATLRHPGIVQVYEVGEENEQYYFFVMEYVAGGDFCEAVVANRLSTEQCLAVIQQVGAALHYAHEQGLVHRDIKPANILLDPQGTPKLTDFDLVRAEDVTTGMTHTGMMGTVIYAAPELMSRPQDAGVQADVYGLAMTAVFALHGHNLPLDVLRNAVGFIEQLGVSEAVKTGLQKGVAWDLSERWDSVAALCLALKPPVVLPIEPQAIKPNCLQEGTSKEAAVTTEGVKVNREPGRTEGSQPAIRRVFIPFQVFQDSLEDGTSSPKMVYIPGGTFTMGDLQGNGDSDEHPIHEVTLSAFAIGLYPLTVAEYMQCVASTTKYHPEWLETGSEYHIETGTKALYVRAGVSLENGMHPVVGICWADAAAYCDWLSKQTREPYSLLTEAQWEYACRAGSSAEYGFGSNTRQLGNYAWYVANAKSQVQPVGQKQPNAWGLYDLHGNVLEWVEDWFGAYSAEAQTNPSGPKLGSKRVVRGGSWFSVAADCRSSFRSSYSSGLRDCFLGFRLARAI